MTEVATSFPTDIHPATLWFERQRNRLEYMSGLFRILPIAAIQVASDRLLKGERPNDRLISVKDPRLKHEFTMTAGYGDVAVYLESMRRIRPEYGFSRQLDKQIEGLPIFDCGANIGIFSVRMASRFSKTKAPVIAIEPSNRSVDILRVNALPYGERIKVMKRAFALNPGPVTCLNPEVAKVQAHYAYSYRQVPEAQGPVAEAVTPEGIMEIASAYGRIGLMKVDIEGGERDIFGSGSPAVAEMLNLTNVLIVEEHDRGLPGCKAAVEAAVAMAGMRQVGGRRHVGYYAR